jgi:hypothetical protein
MWNVDHSAFLCIFGAEHNRGLSDDVSIPRMIKPPLEGFDPARRPLLFSWNFACQRRIDVNCPNLTMGYTWISNLRALRSVYWGCLHAALQSREPTEDNS